MSRRLDVLAGELEGLFAGGVDRPLGEAEFTDLALRVFAHQFEANETYRAFCEGRGAAPGTVQRWEDVPAVPTRGFKHVKLLSGPEAEVVFETSGTTGGVEVRGRHYVPRLSLYRASLLPSFRAHVLPEGRPMPLLSLIPSPDVAPTSSLSAMIGVVAREVASDVRWLADNRSGVDLEGFREVVGRLSRQREPALLVGTAFAFVQLLDELGRSGGEVALPEGTRIMETGGFKGRSRQVPRDELYRAMYDLFDVPPLLVVNEYGMTELLSQLYEPVLTRGMAGRGLYVPPPWLRVRALDPSSLAPLPPGRLGILSFFDLANAGSVSHVLTEDLGSVGAEGVRLKGRLPGSEPRGCSLAVEDLLGSGSRAQ